MILISRTGKLLIAALSLVFCLPLSVTLAQGQEVKPSDLAGKVVRQSGGVLQSNAITKVDPLYPAIARAAKISGPVQIEIEVNEAGNVTSARAISGHPLLRDSAEQAARQWKFKPTEILGQPVKVAGILTFNFVLDGEKSEEREADTKPDSAEAYSKRGEELIKARRFDEALAAFKESIRLKPDDPWAHYQIGMAYVSTRRYVEAEKACSQAVKLRSDELRREGNGERDMVYENATICLGMAAAYLEKYDQAIKHFRKVAELEPKMADVRFMLASVLNRMGDYDGALTAMKESLVLDPNNDHGHNLLVDIGVAGKHSKEVIDFYQQLIKSDPNRAETHYQLGRAYLKFGDKQSAMDEHRALQKMKSGYAVQLLYEINR